MNFNTQSNNREPVNVNTRGIQFMNVNGFVPSTLALGFWNDMVSIKIHPALEKSQQTDSKKFNYEEVVSTALTLEKATVLLSKIQEDVLPAFFDNKDIFRGVPVGGDSLIGAGIKATEEKAIPYLAIFKSLNAETKKPESFIYYEFKTSYTVDDYDPEEGTFNVTQNIPSELKLFASTLTAAIDALTNAFAHSNRHVDKFFRDRLVAQLDEVGTKVGVTPRKNTFSGNYNRKNIFGNKPTSYNTPAKETPEEVPDVEASSEKIKNIESINQFM